MLIQRSHADMEAEGARLLSDTEAASSHQQQQQEEHQAWQQQQDQQSAKTSTPGASTALLHRAVQALCPPQALERAQRGVSAVAATAGELAKPGGTLSPRSLKLLLGAQMAAVALLALALFLVQWQLSALRAATVPPEGEVRTGRARGVPQRSSSRVANWGLPQSRPRLAVPVRRDPGCRIL